MRPRSTHVGFQFIPPPFNSRITDLVIDLEYLRRRYLVPTTTDYYYDQLRKIFHVLDAIGSARVDGNKTSLSKFLEAQSDDPETRGRKTVEIDRIAESMDLIDKNLQETVIFQGFFTELHKILRDDITAVSTQRAGQFRKHEARPDVSGNHGPAPHLIETYLEKLVTYIGKKDPPRNDALKVAHAHQKFLWIHPFMEANGITGRLMTYTMMLKMGFQGIHNRIINPAYAFCHDPEKYLDLIRQADSDKEEHIFAWYEFILEGMVKNMSQMDELTDYEIVKEKILSPAFKHPMFDRIFSEQDRLIMDVAIEKQIFQAADIRLIFPQKHPAEISKMLKWLKEKEWIIPLPDNSRKYVIHFQNKYLVKFIISKLEKAGYIPFI